MQRFFLASFLLIQLFTALAYARGPNELAPIDNLNAKQILILKKLGPDFERVVSGQIQFTPVGEAIIREDLDGVKRLFGEGADLNIPTPTLGFTPLHWAVYFNQEEIVDFLLAQKVDINAQTSGGSTSLYISVALNRPEIFKTLLEKGANPRIARKNGHPPLSIAIQTRNSDAITTLLDHDPTLLHDRISSEVGKMSMSTFAASVGHIPTITLLLNRGADPNSKDILISDGHRRQFYPLASAMIVSNLKMFQYLLKNGADIRKHPFIVEDTFFYQDIPALFYLLENYSDIRFDDALEGRTLLTSFKQAERFMAEVHPGIAIALGVRWTKPLSEAESINFLGVHKASIMNLLVPHLSNTTQSWQSLIPDAFQASSPEDLHEVLMLAAAQQNLETVFYLVRELKVPPFEALRRVRVLKRVFPLKADRYHFIEQFLEHYSAQPPQIFGEANSGLYFQVLPGDLKNEVFRYYRGKN